MTFDDISTMFDMVSASANVAPRYIIMHPRALRVIARLQNRQPLSRRRGGLGKKRALWRRRWPSSVRVQI
jgi:hypothetical protein